MLRYRTLSELYEEVEFLTDKSIVLVDGIDKTGKSTFFKQVATKLFPYIQLFMPHTDLFFEPFDCEARKYFNPLIYLSFFETIKEMRTYGLPTASLIYRSPFTDYVYGKVLNRPAVISLNEIFELFAPYFNRFKADLLFLFFLNAPFSNDDSMFDLSSHIDALRMEFSLISEELASREYNVVVVR